MKRSIKWGISIVSLIIIGIISYYGLSLYNSMNSFNKASDKSRFGNFTPVKNQEPPKWEGKERVNILLLGGDERGLRKNETPRSDSIIVASIDPVTKKAQLFSILRDTYVEIPGHKNNRINVALSLGGPELAMKTVSNLLGIPIQYYLYTDFQGFIAVVDAVNGIDIDVEKNMDYTDSADDHVYDIHLKKGLQHLDGNTALQYVRFRHDALSDFTRTERQRKFLTALAAKMQSTTSILKLPQILSSLDPYIETNLSVTDMLKLASLGYDSKASGITTAQLPPNELIQDKRINGASVLTADEEDLKQYVQDQFKAEPVKPAGENRSVKADGDQKNGDGQETVKSGEDKEVSTSSYKK